MKVLWLTNKVLPVVDEARGKQSGLVNEGWISQMFRQLCQAGVMSVTVVCGGDSVSSSGKADAFNWYTFSENRDEETFYSQKATDYFEEVLKKEAPDTSIYGGASIRIPWKWWMQQPSGGSGTVW